MAQTFVSSRQSRESSFPPHGIPSSSLAPVSQLTAAAAAAFTAAVRRERATPQDSHRGLILRSNGALQLLVVLRRPGRPNDRLWRLPSHSDTWSEQSELLLEADEASSHPGATTTRSTRSSGLLMAIVRQPLAAAVTPSSAKNAYCGIAL